MDTSGRHKIPVGGDMTVADKHMPVERHRWNMLDLLVQASEGYGFHFVSVTDINKMGTPDPGEKLVCTNLTNEFVNRLFSIYGKRQCPLFTRGEFSSAPFSWDTTEIVDEMADPEGSESSARLLDALFNEQDIVGGYCVPVRGASNQALQATFCAPFKCSGISYPELTQTTLSVFDDYFSKVAPLRIAALRLTQREIECLAWVSEGKTSGELAEIVGLSEHTVNHYLLSATRKLDSVNRTQAVAKALRYGLI